MSAWRPCSHPVVKIEDMGFKGASNGTVATLSLPNTLAEIIRRPLPARRSSEGV